MKHDKIVSKKKGPYWGPLIFLMLYGLLQYHNVFGNFFCTGFDAGKVGTIVEV